MAYYAPTNVLLQIVSSSIVTSQVMLSNIGTTNLAYSLNTHATSWLACLPGSGQLAPGESTNILFIGDSSAIVPNIYYSSVTLSRNDPNSPAEIPVTFVVPEPATAIVLVLGMIIAYRKKP